MTNYYKILGVKNFASKEEIKIAYKKLSKKLHPDVNQGDAFFTEKFKEIQEAFEHLNNDSRRKIHDDQLNSQFKTPNETYRQKSNNKHNDSGEYTTRKKPTEKKSKRGLVFIVITILIIIFFAVSNKTHVDNKDDILNTFDESISPDKTSSPEKKSDIHIKSTNLKDSLTKIQKTHEKSDNIELEFIDLPDYFTIGSTKDEVLYIQGNPSRVSKIGNIEYWSFGSSRVEFENGKVSEYSNSSNNLKVKLVTKENSGNGLNYFTIGSTKDEVLHIQGNPSRISKIGNTEYWSFGSSRVEFENGKVSEYSDSSNNLKVKLVAKENSGNGLNYFTIGSTKDEVLHIQGNPSRVSKIGNTEYWSFGSSRVEFVNGKMSEYSNSSNNLKVKLVAKENSGNGLNYFTIGSTKDEVLHIQGNPSRVSKIGNTEYWSFGSSRVEFENGKVSEYSDHSNNLKVKF